MTFLTKATPTGRYSISSLAVHVVSKYLPDLYESPGITSYVYSKLDSVMVANPRAALPADWSDQTCVKAFGSGRSVLVTTFAAMARREFAKHRAAAGAIAGGVPAAYQGAGADATDAAGGHMGAHHANSQQTELAEGGLMG